MSLRLHHTPSISSWPAHAVMIMTQQKAIKPTHVKVIAYIYMLSYTREMFNGPSLAEPYTSANLLNNYMYAYVEFRSRLYVA